MWVRVLVPPYKKLTNKLSALPKIGHSPRVAGHTWAWQGTISGAHLSMTRNNIGGTPEYDKEQYRGHTHEHDKEQYRGHTWAWQGTISGATPEHDKEQYRGHTWAWQGTIPVAFTFVASLAKTRSKWRVCWLVACLLKVTSTCLCASGIVCWLVA